MTSVFSFIILCIPIETSQGFVPVGVHYYQAYSLGDAPLPVVFPEFSFFLSLSLSLSSDRILALEKLGAVFNQVATPLKDTPRKFVIHPQSNNLFMIETDHNAYTDKTKDEKKQQMAEVKHTCFTGCCCCCCCCCCYFYFYFLLVSG